MTSASSAIPRGYGQGGIPVRHRHAGGHTATGGGSRQTDASSSRGSGGGGGHELPLFYGKPQRRRQRRRVRNNRRMSPQARRRAFLRRVFLTALSVVLIASYLRSGRRGGEAELANSVEDFNDWKLLRADRKRRRFEEREGKIRGNPQQRQQKQQHEKEQQQQQQKQQQQQQEQQQQKRRNKGKDGTLSKVRSFGTKGWDLPIIHIVNSRFMQSQGQLKTLAWARLYLFKAFCLSTMIHQTTQNFLWIIRTDPNLHPEIRTALVDMLRPYRNYYLVGSENNYLIGHEAGAWRGGVEGEDVLRSPIHTGDVDLLRRAHEFQNERIVLETRLDADDGLTAGYLEYVQRTALEKFGSGTDDVIDDARDHHQLVVMKTKDPSGCIGAPGRMLNGSPTPPWTLALPTPSSIRCYASRPALPSVFPSVLRTETSVSLSTLVSSRISTRREDVA